MKMSRNKDNFAFPMQAQPERGEGETWMSIGEGSRDGWGPMR